MGNKLLKCIIAGALSTTLALAAPALAQRGGGGMGGGGGGRAAATWAAARQVEVACTPAAAAWVAPR